MLKINFFNILFLKNTFKKQDIPAPLKSRDIPCGMEPSKSRDMNKGINK